MGFLDNLENSLKSLENQEERDGSERKRNESERSRTLAAAPWAEKLKSSPYIKELFEQTAIAGHRIRAKIYMAWLDTTLRLEAKGRKLDLKPTAEGIVAEYLEPDGTTRTEPINLGGKPADLLENWLDPSRQ
jgi:hypothetical protein